MRVLKTHIQKSGRRMWCGSPADERALPDPGQPVTCKQCLRAESQFRSRQARGLSEDSWSKGGVV